MATEESSSANVYIRAKALNENISLMKIEEQKAKNG